MEQASWWTVCVFAADLVIRLALCVRVIMRRLPVGVSLAWMFVVLPFPFLGSLAYLFIGESRLGQSYAKRDRRLRGPYRGWLNELKRREIDWSARGPAGEALSRMALATIGLPVAAGNRVELLPDWEASLRALIKDIDAARQTCHLEFYIWSAGGLADEVGEALLRASARGVICRVLLDDVGSRPFLRGPWIDRLRAGGVSVEAALSARIWRLLFVRFDLRLHRKLVVIDGRIAYTGSQNLADPRVFKQDAGVGEWVDAMVRIEGPVVEQMGVIFLGDWALASPEGIEHVRRTGNVYPVAVQGTAPVQVIPSGPSDDDDGAIERILLTTIYTARKKLVLTTPYFVPDDALMTALVCAAERGVDVTLIVPAKVDSRLANLASRAMQGDLVANGVRVLLFEGGLLHTKSVTADGEISLFGSLNLDPRSLHLNFEITLAIYDPPFTSRLEALLAEYARRSRAVRLEEWQSRGQLQKLVENAARLIGPLL